MAQEIRDDFTGSGAIDSGTWASSASFAGDSSVLVQGGGAVTNVTAATDGTAASIADLSSADCYVEALALLDAGTAGIVIIGLRWDDGTDGYYAQITYFNATQVKVRVRGYDFGGILADTAYTVADPTSVVFRLEAEGTTLRVKLDDVEVWSGTNSSVSAAGGIVFDIPNPPTASIGYIEGGTFSPAEFWTDFVKTAELLA